MEPTDLVAALGLAFPGPLEGKRVVVTAGPTYEDIDPVRYIGNRSSGKMGFAIAAAAMAAGADVCLVAGPVKLETPAGVERSDVRGAVEMRDVAIRLASSADIFIGVAAVADYTPARPAAQKIKKGLPKQKLELVSTPDIIAEVAALENGPFTIGFAAETEKLKQHAFGKLSRKGLDMIAANRVGQSDSGFESENNEILILVPDGEKHLGKGNKQQLARLIIGEVAALLKENEGSETHPDKSTRPASGS